MEETDSLVVSFPTPIIPAHVKEVPVPEKSVPVPLVRTKIAGSTEEIQVVEHPTIVQKGLNVNTINDPVDVQL